MVSYNWANQSVVRKLVASLKDSGYEVWFDVEQTQEGTLEAGL